MRQPFAEQRADNAALFDELNAAAERRQRSFDLGRFRIGSVNKGRNPAERLGINRPAFASGSHQPGKSLKYTLRRRLSPAPKIAHLGGGDNRLSRTQCVLAADQGVDRQDAIHVDMIVHGRGPLAWARMVEKAEADFGRRSGPIFGRRAVGATMAQFQIGAIAEQLAAGAVAEYDSLGIWPGSVVSDDLEAVDHVRLQCS